MTSFTISFPSLVRKLASSRRPLATRVIRALVLLLFIGAIVSLAATAAGAPVKPQFVDISPDDPGTPPGCPAPCPSAGSGGRVHRLATSKAQANDIYAASELGGLFKSENGGFAWRHLDGHLPTRTWDVAVDPGGEIVYATSLYDGRVKSLAGIEVSGNGGETWTHPAMTPPLSCSEGRRSQPSAFGISIRPGSPNEVLAGTNCGLARTTDFGVSWEFIDPVPLTRGVQSVFDVVALPGGLTYACGQDGVMRSPNGRTGWQALPAPYDLEGPYRGYCSMAVHPDFPLAVFVVFSRTTYFDSIFDIRRSSYFASFDGGQTWRFLLHPDGIDPKFHKRVPMVAVNRRSYGLDVWLGAGNLFRMPCVNFPLFGLACPLTDTTAWKGTFTDGAGELFKAHGDTGDVLFDPHPVRDACPLMYSSDGGVFYNAKDEEPGCHDPAFVAVNTGLHAQLLLGMAGVQRAGFEASDVYMALQDDGLFATLNAGASKPSWNHGGTADWLDVVADSTQSLGSIATSAGSILFRGDPGFFNLAQVPNTPALAVPFFVGFTDAVAQWGPSSYVLATDSGPDVSWTSNLSGLTVQNGTVAWTSLGWPSNAGYPCGVRVSRGFLFDTVYVLSGNWGSGACLWRSQNQLWSSLLGFGNWKRLDANPNSPCSTGGFGVFSSDPVRPGRLYASCTGADPPFMVRSEDSGLTWVIDPNLTELMTGPGVFVPKFDDPDNGVTFTYGGNLDQPQPAIAGGVQPAMVAFDPADPNLLLAGGYESGIFISSDAGKGWSLLTDPFTPSAAVPHLPRPFFAHFEHDGPVVSFFVGTVGRGVWRISPATTDLQLLETITVPRCQVRGCPSGPCLTCSVPPGELIDYQARITNAGTGFAGNPVFQQSLPAGLAFQSVQAPPGWLCRTPPVGARGLVRCTGESIPTGDPTTIVVRALVTGKPGTVLQSDISIVSNAIDPDPSNNRVETSNIVRPHETLEN